MEKRILSNWYECADGVYLDSILLQHASDGTSPHMVFQRQRVDLQAALVVFLSDEQLNRSEG